MALTLAKKAAASLGGQFAATAGTDLIWEVVHISAITAEDTIECGGATPATDMVRKPIAVFCFPSGLTTTIRNAAAALVGTVTGFGATIIGSVIAFGPTGGTYTNAEFDVLIIGRP